MDARRSDILPNPHFSARGTVAERGARATRLSQTGFTLLELLVALAVFAVLSVMAYGGLRSVLNGKEHVEQQAARLSQLQTAFTIMERDVEQALGRSIRDSYGDVQPALTGGQFGAVVLELTRTGWRNPAGQRRSGLQRVAYRVDEEQLSRLFWLVVDQAQDSAPVERVLLTGVKSVELRYLDNSLQWQEQWPQDAQAEEKSALPRAVEMTIELEGFGRVRRLFRVPPGEAAQRAALAGPGGANNGQ